MTTFPVLVYQDGSSHPTGSKDLFGATVNPKKGTPGYPDTGPLSLNNAAYFDSLLGVGPVGAVCQKTYLQDGVLPTKIPAGWTALTQAGGRLIVCTMPPRTITAANDQAYVAFIELLVAGLPAGSFEIVHWQEPQTAKHFGGKTGPLGTLADYQALVAHYGALLRQTAPQVSLVYCPALSAPNDYANAQSCLSFYPGKQYADKWLLDYYATAFERGSGLAALQKVAAGADADGVPLGIGELNWAAEPMPFNRDIWETYCDLLAEFFAGRLAAGFNNAEILVWASGNTDAIVAGDQRLVGLRRLHDWLAP